MGVFAYIKNGVKYKTNQFPGAYPANRVSYNGSDVKTALDELNADISYKEIKRASANQTYAQQLAELESYYTALSIAEKRKAKIQVEGGSFIFVSGGTTGNFYTVSGGGSGVYARCLDIIGHRYIIGSIDSNGTSAYVNNSNATHSAEMILFTER